MRESAATVIDAGRFSVHNNGRNAPLYWGIWGLIIVESMVFASLLSSYFYLRLESGQWPPAGVKAPELALPTINTLLLVASSYFVYRADSGIRKSDLSWLARGLAIGAAMALLFLALKWVEYSGLDYRWDSHAYGSIVWTISGFHAAHVTALVLKTLVVLVLARRGYFNGDYNLPVQVNGLYWYFVVVVWLPIYAVLYWTPRVLP